MIKIRPRQPNGGARKRRCRAEAKRAKQPAVGRGAPAERPNGNFDRGRIRTPFQKALGIGQHATAGIESLVGNLSRVVFKANRNTRGILNLRTEDLNGDGAIGTDFDRRDRLIALRAIRIERKGKTGCCRIKRDSICRHKCIGRCRVFGKCRRRYANGKFSARDIRKRGELRACQKTRRPQGDRGRRCQVHARPLPFWNGEWKRAVLGFDEGQQGRIEIKDDLHSDQRRGYTRCENFDGDGRAPSRNPARCDAIISLISRAAIGNQVERQHRIGIGTGRCPPHKDQQDQRDHRDQRRQCACRSAFIVSPFPHGFFLFFGI